METLVIVLIDKTKLQADTKSTTCNEMPTGQRGMEQEQYDKLITCEHGNRIFVITG